MREHRPRLLGALLILGAITGSGLLGWHKGTNRASIEGPITAKQSIWVLLLRRPGQG